MRLSLQGITPAYAGNTLQPISHLCNLKDHPRVCGKYKIVHFPLCLLEGSPPRMREIPCIASTCSISDRITPAYAGNTTSVALLQYISKDHPRVCGKYYTEFLRDTPQRGSPPRMREIPGRHRHGSVRNGITPAYAGNTSCCH